MPISRPGFSRPRRRNPAPSAKLNQARIDVERAKRLRAVNSVSQQEFEQANTAYLSAKAELDRAQQAVKEAQILHGLCIDSRPDRRGRRRQEGQCRRHGQPGPGAAHDVRPERHADDRHGARIAGHAAARSVSRWPRGSTRWIWIAMPRSREIVPEAQAESRSFQVKVTGPCPPNVYSGMFGRIFIPLGEEEVLVVPPEAVRRVGQLDEVDVVENGTTPPPRRAARPDACPRAARCSPGSRQGERVVLPASVDAAGEERRHEPARNRADDSRQARLPQRDRPPVPRHQLLDHPDHRLGADRAGGAAGHAARGGPADRRAAGRRHGQHARATRPTRSSSSSPRRWRRSSTRSTASNTSTAWPARTRRSSPSGSTSARTASGAWSSCSRSSMRTRTSFRRA